ncbi:3',5'-cyclic AMP phosphodiesterase CpdA [Mariniphaga anaerophila]|uniref:3',5'-cyclic AMP phosphodiesterase CpdA n=1 Tax=Mariniphaga anaerophila TaxID=1484053 RepID=A0A1M4VDB6_9BACT|nr:metallophosphoesterase [Mariniphaga anaerophila]SHE66949.1 3',5'-cyclic AMP phosphodiesterase CpdA [Mariniphaga anaerophila]
MSKHAFLLLIFVTAFFVGYGRGNVENEPTLSDKNSFSIIVLPDPQSYTKFGVNQPIFDLMTAWVENNIDKLNIKAVFCTGDLVEQNEYLLPDGINGDQTSREQWIAVSRAFEKLDNKVPYIISTGNHDYGYKRSENALTRFPEYFPVERNNKWDSCLVSVFNNRHGMPTLENSAYVFENENWGKLLVITTEFTPRDEVLNWAKNLSSEKKYQDHKVIFLTHSYLDGDGERIAEESYKLAPANYGNDIWEKLLYPASNIRMLICGHYCTIGSFEENVSSRIDRNSDGKEVFQMMFNAQTEGGGWHGNGGDGWLRILEFMPDGKSIQVKTYSPFFGISPTTKKHAWRTEPWDEFVIDLN